MAEDVILNVGQDAGAEKAFVSRATDPVMSNVATPADFAAQFPTPLDTTEIVNLCEEVNLVRSIPDLPTSLKSETYREMTSLAFTSGSSYLAFADGVCPEEFTHDGGNVTVDLKNIGAKKSLTISDIMHSAAVAAAGWNGINTLVGGWATGEGLPGGADAGTFIRTHIADVKAKEMQLAATLVMNGEDRLLATGDAGGNALEFSGIETLVASGTGAHHNQPEWAASGTFAGINFDRWLVETCAKAQMIVGHPQTIQEMMYGYAQMGYQNYTQFQQINISQGVGGDRLIPGFNFAGEVNTGIGRLRVVADANFTRAAESATAFRANLYALRMTHNGEPLIFRRTQIPMAFKDLAPGCTAVSFQIWKKTALVIKARCAQGVYTSNFTGRIATTCPRIT